MIGYTINTVFPLINYQSQLLANVQWVTVTDTTPSRNGAAG